MLVTAMSGLVPIKVVLNLPWVEAPVPAPATAAEMPGVVDVALPSGATVRVSGCVGMAVLHSLLAELGGR
jgi:hypothetical protein